MMASIAACPHCSSHLQVPAEVDHAARAECPICRAEFQVDQAPVQALPQVVLLPPQVAEEAQSDDLPAPHDAPAKQQSSPVVATGSTDDSSNSELPPRLDEARMRWPGRDRLDSRSAQGEAAPSQDLAIPQSAREVPPPGEGSVANEQTIRDTRREDSGTEASPATANARLPRRANEETSTALEKFEREDREKTPREEHAVDEGSLDMELPESEAPTPASSNQPAAAAKGPSEANRLDQLLSDLMATPDEPGSNQATDRVESPDLLETSVSSMLDDGAESTGTETEPSHVAVPQDQTPSIDNSTRVVDVAIDQRRPRRRLMSRVAIGVLAAVAVVYAVVQLGDFDAGATSDGDDIAEAAPPDDSGNSGTNRAKERMLAAERDESPSAQEEAVASNTIIDSAVQPAAAMMPDRTKPTIAWPLTKLRDPQKFSAAELSAALVSAENAQDAFLRGDLSQSEAVSRKGRAYIAMCQLAERLTQFDPAAKSNGATTDLLLTKRLLQFVVSEPSNRNSLGQIASRWLQYDQRPNTGVLFQGRVTDLNAVGPNTEYEMDVVYQGGSAPVRMLVETFRPRAGDPQTGDMMGVVGVVVDNPREQLIDYTGDAQQLILPTFTFDPSESRHPPVSSQLAPSNMILGP